MGFLDCAALVCGVLGMCVYKTVTWHYEGTLQWERATPNHAGDSDVSWTLLLSLRAVALAVVLTVIFNICTDPNPTQVIGRSTRKPENKVLLRGMTRLTTFTVWCWLLQGVYFFLATMASLHLLPVSMIPLQWILFELSLAMALLVTIVVTFVLVPMSQSRGYPMDFLFKWTVLAMHNLNTLFMLLELVLNRFDIHAYHFPAVLVYGVAYVLFAWANEQWGVGIFYYFFLDYTRPYAILGYLGLFIAVTVFYSFAYWIDLVFEAHRWIAFLVIPASNAIMLWKPPVARK
eukprot:jgi/Bigna1/132277/aug1.17_g6985